MGDLAPIEPYPWVHSMVREVYPLFTNMESMAYFRMDNKVLANGNETLF